MTTPVTVHHLEMRSEEAFRPAAPARERLELIEARIPSPELGRFLYTSVGAGWYWIDRLRWTRSDWLARLSRPEVRTWVAYVEGTPAGYFELETQPGGDVEIVYFGLMPQFVGRRLGGPLLNEAVRAAWGMGAQRVWVHTCSLDHPGALANYLARGFTKFREEQQQVELPATPPEPW